MSFSSAGYQLQPVLPELVLAVGAMVLLMIGAYRGQGTTKLVTTLAIILLVIKRRMSLRSGSRWPASFAYAPCGPSVWMQQYFSTLPGIGATHLAHL